MAKNSYRLALVGAAGLKGKEIKDVIDERDFPTADVRLLDDEQPGQLDSVGDEVTFVQTIDADSFRGMDLAIFAGEEDFTQQHWHAARQAGCGIVDASYALEREAGFQVRSPLVERELGDLQPLDITTAGVVTAHPLATSIALLLARATRCGAFRRVVVSAFEPASERGKRGMDELHHQTVNLLSFQPLPTDNFDLQVAFNMASRWGQNAKSTLLQVEERVLRHYRHITRGGLPVPSLMLLQAPVFHGHTFSIYIEFEQANSPEKLTQALLGEHVHIADPEEEPSNVNVAGEYEVQASVRRDSQRDNAFWIWAAADNLRLTATTALDCALVLASMRPQGKVQ